LVAVVAEDDGVGAVAGHPAHPFQWQPWSWRWQWRCSLVARSRRASRQPFLQVQSQ
jgi:hypothetical protein